MKNSVTSKDQELIALYVSGAASVEEREKVEHYLKTSPIHREEYEWECKIQNAVVSELSVPESVIKNDLDKFDERLQREFVESTPEASYFGNTIDKLKSFFGRLSFGHPSPTSGVPFPALGMAATLCIGAVFAITILPGTMQFRGGINERSPERCDSAEYTPTPVKYHVTVQANANQPVTEETLRALMIDTFPDTPYTITQSGSEQNIMVNSTDCDTRIHELNINLDELSNVKQVRINRAER